MNRTALAALTLLASTAAFPATAQIDNSKPQPAPFSETIPTPVDTPYPGTITINVDASDTSQGLFKVTQSVPVAAAGPMSSEERRVGTERVSTCRSRGSPSQS